ncbi:multiple sugar transport system permease protein [Palleronia marisminoris]|uniref:Trehalose transport system permease protein SugB n=1 Tax=Palleronia marisminoris TaxID=315423 RepID=A0A1Y5TRY1_9RHOB|nr:carbohydrate ABC transporter permease [Palleronia marisminoris]SFH46104.1 multiple sugar transport system permease protein [Palleronia marisminoris]SLN68232.1 Trehalose transport system permease protein SugB [Palleronia marisminoris]
MTVADSPKRRQRETYLIFIALCIFTFINLMPLIWAVLTSLKDPRDAFTIPPTIIFEPTLEYHRQVWFENDFFRYLKNSLIVSAGTVFISVPFGCLAAYALSRIPRRSAGPILSALFTIRMFPHMLLAIPFFVMGTFLNLIDSYVLLILALVAINQPFTIWLMHGFFLEIPRDLDEAAAIDGCTSWQAFRIVILPLARPGMTVAALFSLLLSYNEFLFALVLTGTDTKTLPVAIASFGGEDISAWSLSAAGAIGIMLPIVIVMLVLQRHLVRGLTAGAVKG